MPRPKLDLASLRRRARAGREAARPFAARYGTVMALGAILLLGLHLRFELSHWNLPYMHHWDEPAVASRSIRMLQAGDLDPHFFNYGSLPIYMAAAVDAVVVMKLAGLPVDDPESITSIGEVATVGSGGWPWEVSHPTFLLWNRRLVALIGVAVIVLSFFLARELAGKRRGGVAGLLAAAWLAVTSFHIEHSSIVTVDVTVSFFALLVLWSSWLAWRDDQPRLILLSAACVGLAIACKYNSAVYMLAPLAVALWGCLRRDRTFRPWLLLAVPAISVAVFFLAMPYALLSPREFLDDAAYEVHHYTVRGSGKALDVEPGWPHLASDLGRLRENLGYGGAGLALVGLTLALRRGAGWVLFTLPLLQLYLTSLTLPNYHRNVVILYPMAAVAIGLAVPALASRLGTWIPERFRTRVRAALVLAVLFWLGVRTSDAYSRVAWFTMPDTRQVATDRLERELEGSSLRLGVAAELHLHPLDLRRLPEDTVERPFLELLCRPEGEDRLLLPAETVGGEEGEAEGRNRLITGAGIPLWEEGPSWGALSLTYFSVRPRMVFLRAPAVEGGIPVACAEGGVPRPSLRLSGPAALYTESVGLAPGAEAATRDYRFPRGTARYTV
ncbi:MAG: glycosyltransferase family 39 protein, partial [Holophagales bacterium]|nr:glycosyltransferase family 39 protein [Holophagales bacterium]